MQTIEERVLTELLETHPELLEFKAALEQQETDLVIYQNESNNILIKLVITLYERSFNSKFKLSLVINTIDSYITMSLIKGIDMIILLSLITNGVNPFIVTSTKFHECLRGSYKDIFDYIKSQKQLIKPLSIETQLRPIIGCIEDLTSDKLIAIFGPLCWAEIYYSLLSSQLLVKSAHKR
jgi:hypothetical protein